MCFELFQIYLLVLHGAASHAALAAQPQAHRGYATGIVSGGLKFYKPTTPGMVTFHCSPLSNAIIAELH